MLSLVVAVLLVPVPLMMPPFLPPLNPRLVSTGPLARICAVIACAPCSTQVSDPSLLRFLVDLRGEDSTDRQLRDDLMTMLIAGHETTAAVLTWATFILAQRPDT